MSAQKSWWEFELWSTLAPVWSRFHSVPFHFQWASLFYQTAGILSVPVPLVSYCSAPLYQGCLCRELSSKSIRLYLSPGLLANYKEQDKIKGTMSVIVFNSLPQPKINCAFFYKKRAAITLVTLGYDGYGWQGWKGTVHWKCCVHTF